MDEKNKSNSHGAPSQRSLRRERYTRYAKHAAAAATVGVAPYAMAVLAIEAAKKLREKEAQETPESPPDDRDAQNAIEGVNEEFKNSLENNENEKPQGRLSRYSKRVGQAVVLGPVLFPAYLAVEKALKKRAGENAPSTTNDANPAVAEAERITQERKEELDASDEADRIIKDAQSTWLRNTKTGARRIFLFGPGGLLIGFLPSRVKERLFAKDVLQKLGQASKQRAKNAPKNILLYGHFPDLVYLAARRFLPQKWKNAIKRRIDSTGIQRRFNKAFKKGRLWKNYTRRRIISDVKSSRLWKYKKFALAKADPISFAIFHAVKHRHKIPGYSKLSKTLQQPLMAPIQDAIKRAIKFAWKVAKAVIKAAWRVAKQILSKIPYGRLLVKGVELIGKAIGKIFKPIIKGLGKILSGKLELPNAGDIAKKLGKKVVKKAVRAALMNPATLTGIGVFLLILFIVIGVMMIIITVFGGGGDNEFDSGGGQVVGPGGGQKQNPIPGLTLAKAVDKTQTTFPDQIVYTITYTYSPPPGSSLSFSDITLYDPVPLNSKFVDATGGYSYDATTGIVSWKLAGLTGSIQMTVSPNSNNVVISNTAYALAFIAGDGIIDAADSLDEIFRVAGANANVPVPLIKAIANTESGVLGYNEDEVVQFNTLNWFQGRVDNAPTREGNDPLILRGYAYNTCLYAPCTPGSDVRGAMQFELGTWNNIKQSLSFADGHDPDRRYVRDNIMGAAKYLRQIIDQHDSTYNFTSNLDNLTERQVKAVSTAYCVGPYSDLTTEGKQSAACGYGAHGDNAWAYYQEFKAAEGL